MPKNKLISLVATLNDPEFSFAESFLSKLNLTNHLSLLRTIRFNKIKSSRQLKEFYSVNGTFSGLTKHKKELYSLIIDSLEKQNSAYSTKYPQNESIVEYYNIKDRYGMADLKRDLMEESIAVNRTVGNIGSAFDLSVEYHNVLVMSEFSSQKSKEHISSMQSLVKEMSFLTELFEVGNTQFEIYLKNMSPAKDSNDYKLLLDLLSSKVMKSVESIQNNFTITYWFTVKSILYASLNQLEDSCNCLKEGIQYLTTNKTKDIYWNGVISLYINLLRYYLSENINELEASKKEFHQFLEHNKQFMYKNIYIKGKMKLFVIEIGACQVQSQWSKGVAMAKKELSKKMYKDFQFNISPMNFHLAIMAFGLKEYDLALDFFDKALDNLKIKFPSKEYFISIKIMIVLCNIEKHNYKSATSQIDALRKYIGYHKIKDQYYSKFLQMSKRYVRHRGSDKQAQILLEFYTQYSGKSPKKGSLDFQWVQSKVENRTVMDICNAF